MLRYAELGWASTFVDMAVSRPNGVGHTGSDHSDSDLLEFEQLDLGEPECNTEAEGELTKPKPKGFGFESDVESDFGSEYGDEVNWDAMSHTTLGGSSVYASSVTGYHIVFDPEVSHTLERIALLSSAFEREIDFTSLHQGPSTAAQSHSYLFSPGSFQRAIQASDLASLFKAPRHIIKYSQLKEKVEYSLSEYRHVEFKYGAKAWAIEQYRAGNLVAGGDSWLCEWGGSRGRCWLPRFSATSSSIVLLVLLPTSCSSLTNQSEDMCGKGSHDV